MKMQMEDGKALHRIPERPGQGRQRCYRDALEGPLAGGGHFLRPIEGADA